MTKTELNHKLKFTDGIAIYIGKGITTKPHGHFALEIILSLNKPFDIITNKKVYSNCNFAIIPQNIKHQFIGNQDDHQVFIFIDPFHQLANFLEKEFDLSELIITSLQTPSENNFPTLQQWIQMETKYLSETISKLFGLQVNTCLFENKTDTRIIKSFQYIQENLHKKISIKSISNSVFLSESRYAHLFKLSVGIPFRRYILWQRMQKTIQAILEGDSLTAACYDGGFSDISHFNKVFKEMFGITPSAVLKS